MSRVDGKSGGGIPPRDLGGQKEPVGTAVGGSGAQGAGDDSYVPATPTSSGSGSGTPTSITSRTVKAWTTSERRSNVGLLTTATLARTRFTTTEARRDASLIFETAITQLQTKNFVAADKDEGKMPTASAIAAALSRGYNQRYKTMPEASRIFTKNDIAKDSGILFKALHAFIDQNAAELKLVGTKPVKKKKPAGPRTSEYNADTVAHRVLTAGSILGEIIDIEASLPGNADIAAIKEKATAVYEQLASLGGDEAALTSKLRNITGRDKTIKKIEELAGLRDKAIVIHTRLTVDFSNPSIDNYFEDALASALLQMDRRPADLPMDRAKFEPIFETVLRNYIAIWLSEQSAGERRKTLEISESAYVKTKLILEGKFESDEQKKAAAGYAGRLLHHVAKDSAFRLSVAEDDAETADEVKEQTIRSPEKIRSLVGDGVSQQLDSFYDEIRQGKITGSANPTESAKRFYEFMTHYIRRASNEYADSFGPEHLPKLGLETKIAKSIFLRVDGAKDRFDEETVELVRTFFTKIAPAVTTPKARELIPTIEEFRLASAHARMEALGEDGFISFTNTANPLERMTLREFIAQIFGTESPAFKDEFRHETGMNWESFLMWGEARSNPDTMPQIHWDRIAKSWDEVIAFADEQSLLSDDFPRTLSEFLVTYTPEATDTGDWHARTSAISTEDELVKLAIGNKPKGIPNELWSAYTSWRIANNRGEDVIAGPSNDNQDTLLTAYDYLNKLAASHGQRIDFMEYLATIYPIVGRMLLRAQGGMITLPEPEVMSGLFYEVWSYKKWAENINANGYERHTDVVPGTHSAHRRKNITPEFWDVRRYATPALARRLGISQEMLYEIIGGYLRASYFILSRAAVYDTRGGKISHRGQGIASKYSIRFQSVETRPGLELSGRSGVEKEVDDHIKRGTYDKKLEFMRSYVRSIESSLEKPLILDEDGNELTIAELEARIALLEKKHIINSSIFSDNSTTAGSYSPDDIRAVREFYVDEFDGFLKTLTGEITITGEIKIGEDSVPAQISYEDAGFALDGHVGISAGLISAKAAHKLWSFGHVAELLKLDAIVSYAIATSSFDPKLRRNAEAVKALAAPSWPADGSLRGVVTTYTELENEIYYRPEGLIPCAKSTARNASKDCQGPLPSKRKLIELFRAFAANEMGLDEAKIDKALRILMAYIKTIGHVRNRFWPHTLNRMIERNEAADDPKIRKAIEAFLPKIGLAAKVEMPAMAEGSGSATEHIALKAFEDYRDLIPQPMNSKVSLPLDMDLLYDIVQLHIENFQTEEELDAGKILQIAAINIEEHNRTADGNGYEKVKLPYDGLLGSDMRELIGASPAGHDVDRERLLHKAYFSLRGKINAGQTITENEIRTAISNISPSSTASDEDVRIMTTLIEIQSREMGELSSIVKDEETGIAAFVRDAFHAPYISIEALEQLALEYIRYRVTGNLPVETKLLASRYINGTLSRYPSIMKHVAGSYQSLIEGWIAKEAKRHLDVAELSHLRVLELSDDSAKPARSSKDLKERLVAASNISFDEIETMDFRHRAISHLLGRGYSESPIAEAIDEAYEATVIPAQKALDDELSAAIDNAADLHMRSREIYLQIDAIKLPKDEDEAALRTALDALKKSETLLNGLQSSLSEAPPSPDRAHVIVEIRGTDSASEHAVASIPVEIHPDVTKPEESTESVLAFHLTSARTYVRQAEEDILEKQVSVEDRLQSITSGRTLNAAQTAQAMVSARTTALEEVADRIEADLAEIESSLAPAATNLEATAIPNAASDFATYEATFTGMRSVNDEVLIIARRVEADLRALKLLTDGKPSGDEGARLSAGEISEIAIEAADAASEKIADLLTTAIFTLEGKIEEAPALETRATGDIRAISDRLESAFSTFLEKENELPAGKTLEIEEHPQLPFGDVMAFGDKTVRFIHKGIGKSQFKRAQGELKPFIEGHMLAISDGSFLILPRDATAIENWKNDKRPEDITITSLLGTKITLKAGQIGVRVSATKDIDDTHPLSRALRAIRLIASSKTNEVQLLADILNDKHATAKEPIRQLMGYFAFESIGSAEDALSTLRSWAVMRSVTRGGHVVIAKEREPIYGDRFSPERQAGLRDAHTELQTNPHIGALAIFDKKDEGKKALEPKRLVPVDMKDTDARIADGADTIRFFNNDAAAWEEMNLRELDANSYIDIDPVFNEHILFRNQFLTSWLILHNRRLLELSWMAKDPDALKLGDVEDKESEDAIGYFMNNLLLSAAPGYWSDDPHITLEETQPFGVQAFRLAREERRSVTVGPEAPLDRSILSWIDAFPHNIKMPSADRKADILALQRMMKNPKYAEGMRMLYLIHHYSGDYSASAETVKLLMIAAVDREWKEIAGSHEKLVSLFRKHVGKIYDNLHRPIFVGTDEKLDRMAPEVSRMGPAQLWATLAIMEPAMENPAPERWPTEEISSRIEKAPGWMRILIQRLPHLAKGLCIVALTYEKLPDDFKKSLHILTQECFEDSAIVERQKMLAYTEQFRKIYKSQSQYGVNGHDAIIRALQDEIAPGLTLGRWLTGTDEPWQPVPEQWEGVPAHIRLRYLAPEYFKAREWAIKPFMERMAAKLAAIDEDIPHVNMMKFLERHPEFRSAFTLSFLASAKMDSKIKARLMHFFADEKGIDDPEGLVDVLAEPDFIVELRKALQEPYDDKKDVPYAMDLTGEYEPWLPSELLPPDQRLLIIVPQLENLSYAQSAEAFRDLKKDLVDQNAESVYASLKPLFEFGERHPELQTAITAFNMAMFMMSRSERFAVYDALKSGLSTPEEFVHMIVEHALAHHMNAVIENPREAADAILLPSLDMDGQQDLSMNYIENRLEALGVLPAYDSAAFDEIIASYIDAGARGMNQIPEAAERLAPGSGNARESMARLVASYPRTMKKIIALLRIIDQEGDFYLQYLRDLELHSDEVAAAKAHGRDRVGEVTARIAYRFLVSNREETLMRVEGAKKRIYIEQVERALPLEHKDRIDSISFEEMEHQIDSLGIVPRAGTQDFEDWKRVWIEEDTTRTFAGTEKYAKKTLNKPRAVVKREVEMHFDTHLPVYRKMAILVRMVDRSGKLATKMITQMEEEMFFDGGKSATRLPKTEFEEIVIKKTYLFIINNRQSIVDMILKAIDDGPPMAEDAIVDSLSPSDDRNFTREALGPKNYRRYEAFMARMDKLLSEGDFGRSDLDMSYIEAQIDALEILPDTESPEFAKLHKRWIRELKRREPRHAITAERAPMVFKKAMLLLLMVGQDIPQKDMNDAFSVFSKTGAGYDKLTVSLYHLLVKHKGIVIKIAADNLREALRTRAGDLETAQAEKALQLSDVEFDGEARAALADGVREVVEKLRHLLPESDLKKRSPDLGSIMEQFEALGFIPPEGTPEFADAVEKYKRSLDPSKWSEFDKMPIEAVKTMVVLGVLYDAKAFDKKTVQTIITFHDDPETTFREKTVFLYKMMIKHRPSVLIAALKHLKKTEAEKDPDDDDDGGTSGPKGGGSGGGGGGGMRPIIMRNSPIHRREPVPAGGGNPSMGFASATHTMFTPIPHTSSAGLSAARLHSIGMPGPGLHHVVGPSLGITANIAATGMATLAASQSAFLGNIGFAGARPF